MHRRRFLKNAGFLAAASVAGGCSSRPEPRASVPPRLKLAPVRVSKDRIIRTVVGLRPFRPSGFRVEKEKLGSKIVVHNYGHGGGGITLSWGTSHIAVDELFRDEPPRGRVAVLGAGALGLATARLLQRRSRGHDLPGICRRKRRRTSPQASGPPTSFPNSPSGLPDSRSSSRGRRAFPTAISRICWVITTAFTSS
jgi:glycine/D-amino acid oxidase-like deaminating enzyme